MLTNTAGFATIIYRIPSELKTPIIVEDLFVNNSVPPCVTH